MSRLAMLFVMFILMTRAQSIAAQESVGFVDPKGIDSLLEYRLPEWGYKTWDLSLGIDGKGHNSSVGDDKSIFNENAVGLGSSLVWARFGEDREARVTTRGNGNYTNRHLDDPMLEDRRREVLVSVGVDGTWDVFFGNGPFMAGIAGGTNLRYHEVKDRNVGAADPYVIMRNKGIGIGPRVGVGRVRDVVPLVRAQRLSERLVALGRRPLRADQVRQIADVLAVEHGYREVFERPERSFWRDVLTPMLETGNGLTPYEIFYLRDILDEDLGNRAQGTALTLTTSYNETRSERGNDKWTSLYRSATLKLNTYHNLSLHHQLHALVSVRAVDSHHESGPRVSIDPGALVEHLWSVADRYRLTTRLHATSGYKERDQGIYRGFHASATSRLQVFVENRMAVVARAHLGFDQFEYPDDRVNRGWRWTYGLGLEYALDNLLY